MLTIALVAVLVFGPDKLPDLARQAGKMARQLRSFAHAARDELRSELGPEYADLQLRDLDPRVIVRKHIMEAMNEDDGADQTRAPQRALLDGEAPPFDLDAT
jgi:sec-independent protein translocase protein TatB